MKGHQRKDVLPDRLWRARRGESEGEEMPREGLHQHRQGHRGGGATAWGTNNDLSLRQAEFEKPF